MTIQKNCRDILSEEKKWKRSAFLCVISLFLSSILVLSANAEEGDKQGQFPDRSIRGLVSINLGYGSTNNGALTSYEIEYEGSGWIMNKGRWVITGLQLGYKKDDWKWSASGIGIGVRGFKEIGDSGILHSTVGLNTLYANYENRIGGVKVSDNGITIGPRFSLGYRHLIGNLSLNIAGDLDVYLAGQNILNKSPLYSNSILPTGKFGIGYTW